MEKNDEWVKQSLDYLFKARHEVSYPELIYNKKLLEELREFGKLQVDEQYNRIKASTLGMGYRLKPKTTSDTLALFTNKGIVYVDPSEYIPVSTFTLIPSPYTWRNLFRFNHKPTKHELELI